jgi:hypothetical protein
LPLSPHASCVVVGFMKGIENPKVVHEKEKE